MTGAITIEVSTQSLDFQKAVKTVTSSSHGAIDAFIGTVRNYHEDRNVTGITYDVHVALAEKTFHDICEEALGLWPGTRYYVAHYHGILEIGGISIIIAVSAPHRAESFDVCRYVIEEIKKRAPVWKKEHYTDGISDWLPGHSLTAEAKTETLCCGHCVGRKYGAVEKK